MSFQFLQRSSGHAQVVEKFLRMLSSLTLGDGRRDRGRCAPNLTGHPKEFFLREVSRHLVTLLGEDHSPLPHFQFSIVLKRHRSSPRAWIAPHSPLPTFFTAPNSSSRDNPSSYLFSVRRPP